MIGLVLANLFPARERRAKHRGIFIRKGGRSIAE
jgi:hypothetical protein